MTVDRASPRPSITALHAAEVDAQYYDIAASKRRGQRVCRVGIKRLPVCEEVSRNRRSTQVATRWHLASRHRAPWQGAA
jgi:hypothetical protein